MCTLWKVEGQNTVSKAEYFVDTDPGRGKATPITITTPSPNVRNVPFTVTLTSLSIGFHRVYMRTYDGRWSHTSSTIIYKLPASSSLTKISGAEYFVDTDPGKGKGKPISITAIYDVSDASFTLPLTGVTEGFHRLYLRTRNGNLVWSHASSYIFYKMVVGVNDTTIVQAEYFVDSDPGHGKATAITITPNKNIVNAAFSLPLSSLTEGFHKLYLRTKDGFKRWSLTNNQLFYKYVIPQTDTTITQVEYYVDSDPGFGKATQVSITPGKNLVNSEFTLPLTSVSTGIHRLCIRSKNGYKKWSHNASVLFYKYEPSADTALTQVEYFIDTDPGFGKGVPVAMNPATRWRDSTFQMNITGLSKGTHTFYLRTRSNSGKWSLTNTDTFHIGTVPVAPAIVVSKFTNTGLCAGEKFDLSYHRTGVYPVGNIFTAQLSDKNGTFNNPIAIGTYTSNTSGIINCKLPSHLNSGFRYKVRIVSSNPVVTGVVSRDSLYINDRPDAPIIIGDSNVNVNADNLYSVPLTTLSTYKWFADSATISSVKNEANIKWSKPGTARNIAVVETSRFGCIGDKGTKQVNIFDLSIDSVQIQNLSVCPGTVSSVTAKVSGVYSDTNVFNAQLSDVSGNFGSPIVIGSLTTNSIGVMQPINIPVTIPNGLAGSTTYKIRVVSSVPVATSSPSVSNIIISKPNLGADKRISKCPGSAVNLSSLFTTTGLVVTWNVTRPDSVVNTGMYRLIVSNTRGCKDTAFVTVSDYIKPNVGNDTTVYTCIGIKRSIRNVYNLTAFPVQQWSTPTPDTVGAGVYTLIVENAQGCKDTAVITVVEKSAATPIISPSGTVPLCSGDSVLLSVKGGNFATYLWSNGNTTSSIFAKTTGSYSVSVTDSAGCSNTSVPVTIQAASNPAVPTITTSPVSTSNLCPGTSVSLTSSVATRYLWSTNDTTQVIATNVAGTYTVKVFNTNGCKATSAVKSISYSCPAPINLASSGITASSAVVSWNNPACFGSYELQYRKKGTLNFTTLNTSDSTFALTGLTVATIYQWRLRTICVINPFTASNYTALFEFTTSASFAKAFNPAIVQTDESKSWKASIYPNPALQKAVLQVSGLNNFVATISNTEGKVLWQTSIVGKNSLALPINNLATGVYIVSVRNKTEIKNIRFVVEK